MSGAYIPIDYLSDHLDNFEVSVRFTSGQGYRGRISFNGILVFETQEIFAEAQDAFANACLKLEQSYQELFDTYKTNLEL